MNTTRLIKALNADRIVVSDVRGELPTHPTRKYKARSVDKIEGLVVHHAGGQVDGLSGLKNIARYHVTPSSGGSVNHLSAAGAPGIAYPLAIDSSGRLYVCHDLSAKTWSQGDKSQPGDENARYLAVLVMGNFDSPSNPTGRHPTARQVETLLALFRVLREQLGWSPGALFGHFDFGKAACPGALLEALIRGVRRPNSSAPMSELEWQRALNEWDSDLPPLKEDGEWGPKSKARLQAFQEYAGLPVSGSRDARTWNALAAL